MIQRIRMWILAGLSVVLASGCASVAMAPADNDTAAKAFQAEPGKAALYIYRNESFGAAIPMTVAVNGKTLGQSAAQTYFRANLAPGKYKIESHAENVAELTLDVLSERIYYVWQEVKMGLWMARSQLQQMDEAAGKKGVMESKLIAGVFRDEDLIPLGASGSAVSDATAQKLRDLQALRQDGTISEADYQSKKKELLDRM